MYLVLLTELKMITQKETEEKNKQDINLEQGCIGADER